MSRNVHEGSSQITSQTSVVLKQVLVSHNIIHINNAGFCVPTTLTTLQFLRRQKLMLYMSKSC